MAAKKPKLLTKKQRKAKEQKEKEKEEGDSKTSNLPYETIINEGSKITDALDNIRIHEALKNACMTMQERLNTNDIVTKLGTLHTKRRRLEEDTQNIENLSNPARNYIKKNILNWNKKVLKDSGVINFAEKISGSSNNFNYIKHCEAKGHEQVVVRNIISPSCIFVRRKDSSYKNFEVRLPCTIQQFKWKNKIITLRTDGPIDKESLSIRQCVGWYVLAPYKKDLYVRARVLAVSESSTYVKVIYIDHGSTAWVHKKTLAVLDDEKFNYRWETRPVALKNVYPIPNSDGTEVECWTVDHINALKTVMSKYQKFEFRTVFHEKRIYANNLQMVEIYAVKDFTTSTPCNYFCEEIQDSDDDDCVNSIIHSDDCLKSKTQDPNGKRPMSINAELIKMYPKLFYRKKYIGKRAIEPLYDIVTEAENRFIQKCNLPWFRYFPLPNKSATPTFWSRFPKYRITEKEVEPCYEMNYKVDHWNYQKLKNSGYIFNDKYMVIDFLKPYFPYNAQKLTGIPLNRDEVVQLKIQLMAENANLRQVYDDHIEKKLEWHHQKIVSLSQKYLEIDNVPHLTIQDIISLWQEGEPCYCTINSSFTLDSGMWYRFEVIGFKHVIEKYYSTFLVKVRYLDTNGFEVFDISNLYQLPEASDNDLPLVLNFDYDVIKIKNEGICSEDEVFISYIKTLLAITPYNIPIVVELDTENSSDTFPNTNRWSTNFNVCPDILKTDIKIKNLYTFEFNEIGEFYSSQIGYKLLSQHEKYQNLFKNVSYQRSEDEEIYYNMDNINDYNQTITL